VEFPFEKTVESELETSEIAKLFSEKIIPGEVVCLNGNLGTGKTFFIKSVCKEFNIADVSSPTFAIVNQHNGKYQVNHFDLYRIKKAEELYDIGFEEYLADSQSISFIEWADLFEDEIAKCSYKVYFEFLGSTKRKIRIEKYG
jgi:tRNA threonylcarbamoyladenosine biosynthesis protein TsaE